MGLAYPLLVQGRLPVIVSFFDSSLPLLRERALNAVGRIGRHQYKEDWSDHKGGRRTLILNPGSCGPRRFHQAITMALLTIDKDGWTIERIKIPHEIKGKIPDNTDLKTVIQLVMTETEKGRSPAEIAKKNKLESSMVETIVRLYLTHPGVTADGIMTKMGF